jgi:hypothetical protein
MSAAGKVIVEARKHVGYVEGPKKDNIFGKWYGANHTAWCAMFVSYCINKAGYGNLIAGAQTKKGFASCGAGIKFFKAKKAWFPIAKAKQGDLAFFDWDHDGSQDHVGLVVSVDLKNKRVKTIEGNTSGASKSNGGVCKETWRSFSVIMGVGRPAYPADPAPVAPVEVPAAAVEPTEVAAA